MLDGLLRTVRQLLSREVTFGHVYHYVMMRLFPNTARQDDDFDWQRYPRLYQEELKGIARVHTLVLRQPDFSYDSGRIEQKNASVSPVHPNHRLLYELVLGIAPKSALEVGCGAGDHLRNLHLFDPSMELHGIDRSAAQLEALRKRHPNLPATLGVVDLTIADAQLPHADLAYSQAVLMHISENSGRFDTALRNVLSSARRHVVMIENWQSHDFVTHLKAATNSNAAWAGASLSFASLGDAPEVKALILSKAALPRLPSIIYSVLAERIENSNG